MMKNRTRLSYKSKFLQIKITYLTLNQYRNIIKSVLIFTHFNQRTCRTAINLVLNYIKKVTPSKGPSVYMQIYLFLPPHYLNINYLIYRP